MVFFPSIKRLVKAKEARRTSSSLLLGRAAFMGLRVGYNLVSIVIINVSIPVGRPKTFGLSIATCVALKRVPLHQFKGL